MSEVTGLVESLKKDRTGLKLDNGKWYGGSQDLKLNKGDKVELSLDEGNKDNYGNPTIAHVKIISKAPNPYNQAGGFKGGYTKSQNSTARPSGSFNDPDTQARIARSHAITTAISFLTLQGKKSPTLSEAFKLADEIRAYTEGSSTKKSPPKPTSSDAFGDDDD